MTLFFHLNFCTKSSFKNRSKYCLFFRIQFHSENKRGHTLYCVLLTTFFSLCSCLIFFQQRGTDIKSTKFCFPLVCRTFFTSSPYTVHYHTPPLTKIWFVCISLTYLRFIFLFFDLLFVQLYLSHRLFA